MVVGWWPLNELTESRYIAKKYRSDLKFSDRQVWANSVDPDQTAPTGAVWLGPTLFAIPSASFDRIILR